MTEKTYDFPTEVLDLPSGGKIYPKESPLSSGQITIKYMTAKEEDILASTNLIRKGIVLDKLFESIIVDNVNPNDIIIGDKNAIVLATRLLGYGADYPISFYSSKTGEQIDAVVDLSKVQTKEVDTSIFNNKNEFEFILPSNGKKITFKLLTHGDELAIQKDIDALEKLNKDSSFEITTRLRHMIKSVDGNNDISVISKFVNGMLAKDSKALRNYIKSISPDVDMVFTHIHEDGETEVVPITMGVGFFWPSEKS
jgi:hypothetical protein